MSEALCPDCNVPLRLMYNWRMDFLYECIPTCYECHQAFRDPALGWELLDADEEKE